MLCRELDHQNLCKFVGCCTDAANFCVLMEYCPKGSISDVLLNDDIPLNWAFRYFGQLLVTICRLTNDTVNFYIKIFDINFDDI